ncbi:MAG TPA: 50S ribosomal protein L9 [Verrucomicrobiae bacterium]|jgi:large subunit ribosomal protein L9|nr:50S ribosomal protein L9 [Verrucomicrobiae bacterium]
MAKTEVILIQNIVGLGGESDLVKVASGYARNYLFPQGLAVPLTSANKRRIESLKQRRGEREAHEFNTMTELSKSISKLIAVLQVKTGDDGKMFGSVTAGMIADQLKTQFDIVLDKRKIHLEHPIKTLGEHDIALRLHAEVAATLKVRVESTTPVALPTDTRSAGPEARERDRDRDRDKEGAARTESRGHKRAERVREEKPPGEIDEKPARPERKPRAPRGEKTEASGKAEKAEKGE